MRPSDRYPVILLLGFIAIFAAMAIRPWYRQDWLLENLLVLIAGLVLLKWVLPPPHAVPRPPLSSEPD
jgi:putative membrane protein